MVSKYLTRTQLRMRMLLHLVLLAMVGILACEVMYLAGVSQQTATFVYVVYMSAGISGIVTFWYLHVPKEVIDKRRLEDSDEYLAQQGEDE